MTPSVLWARQVKGRHPLVFREADCSFSVIVADQCERTVVAPGPERYRFPNGGIEAVEAFQMTPDTIQLSRSAFCDLPRRVDRRFSHCARHRADVRQAGARVLSLQAGRIRENDGRIDSGNQGIRNSFQTCTATVASIRGWSVSYRPRTDTYFSCSRSLVTPVCKNTAYP